MKNSRLKHLYKHLPTYGFIGATLLIMGAVTIFNIYWSALGANPKTALMPQITKDYEEFKDYTTLIIALISAVGSLLSSLLIMLFYGAWKEQHNKIEDAKLAKEVYLILQQEKEKLIIFKSVVNKTPYIPNASGNIVTTVNAEKIESKISEIINESLLIKSNLIIFSDLTGDSNFENKENLHGQSLIKISNFWLSKIKTPTVINEKVKQDNIKICKEHEDNIDSLKEILKNYIKII